MFGHFLKAHGAIERNGFRGVVRCQLNLTHMAVPIQNRLQQRRADPRALMFREYQNVLNKHDGITVTHDTDNAQQLFIFVGCQNQQRVLETLCKTAGWSV